MISKLDTEKFLKDFTQNCKSIQRKSFKKGHTITTYIEKRNQICILLNGEADLVRYDLNGDKAIIEHFTKNDIFGEAFYVVTTNNELSVEAKKNCDFLVMTIFIRNVETIVNFIKLYPKIFLHLFWKKSCF